MIQVDINKAKNIAHDIRRELRAKEFQPLDVQATIPSMAKAAEAERAKIRAKYEAIQAEIDSAEEVEALKTIVDQIKG